MNSRKLLGSMGHSAPRTLWPATRYEDLGQRLVWWCARVRGGKRRRRGCARAAWQSSGPPWGARDGGVHWMRGFCREASEGCQNGQPVIGGEGVALAMMMLRDRGLTYR